MDLNQITKNSSEDFKELNNIDLNEYFGKKDNPVRSKYGAIRTEYNGKVYPSKKQADYARMLEALKGKEIKSYIEEVAFRLPGGSIHRVDFGVINFDNTVSWVEVKGKDLPMGKLKRKQTEEIYGIKITVV
jgi:hypothetical protein